MNKSTYPQQRPLSVTMFAAASAFVAVGILSAVAIAFQRSGMPLVQLAAAERACMHYAYVSERQACMNAWMATQRTLAASK